jgi:hypothetical protein
VAYSVARGIRENTVYKLRFKVCELLSVGDIGVQSTVLVNLRAT